MKKFLAFAVALFFAVATLEATVSSTTSRVAYTGNGATTAFSFPYIFQANTDLVVYLRDTTTLAETLEVYITDYTVTGRNNPSGGTVSMNTAPTSGQQVVIYRDPPRTQDLSLNDGGAISYKQIELRLDKLTLQSQRFADIAARSVRQADGDTASVAPSLPVNLANLPYYVIGLNATATGWSLYPPVPAPINGSGSILGASQGGTAVNIVKVDTIDPFTATLGSGIWTLSANTNGTGPLLRQNNPSVVGNINVSANANVANLTATGNVNGANANFSGTADITGNTNVVNLKATGNTNGVNGNFSGTMDITGNENVVNLKASANVNSVNGNFSGTIAAITLNDTGNANFSGNLITPNVAGAPAGVVAGSLYNDTTQQAPTYNSPISATNRLVGMFAAALTADSSLSSFTTAANIGSSAVVPANVFTVGKTVRCTAYGTYTNVASAIFTASLITTNSGGTVTLGTQAGIGTGAAVAPQTATASATPFKWVFYVVGRSTGSSGTWMTSADLAYGSSTISGDLFGLTANTAVTVNTTLLNTLRLQVACSANSASNLIVIKNETWEAMN